MVGVLNLWIRNIYDRRTPMKAFREIMSWVIPIAIGLIIALLIKSYWFTLVRVDGTSMDPI